jgi:SAM-dependent methyltransferase
MKTASLNVAKWIAKHFLPEELRCNALKLNSTIHDNGCGVGTATEAILTTSDFPPPRYQFECTDIDHKMLQTFEEEARASHYPANIHQMNSDNLKFPDNHFDISFTHFVVPYLFGNTTDTARHLYRTLRPGGRAVVTTWAYLPHDGPVSRATFETRGMGSARPAAVEPAWSSPPKIVEFFRDGGFDTEKCTQASHRVTFNIEDNMLHLWASDLWSSVGMRAEGWIREDEDNWNQTIDVIVRELKRAKGVRHYNGHYRLQLQANVVVAQKKGG